MFPIMLDLRDRRCLVVGAGTVAQRKLTSLLDEGARVTVVAPEVVDPIANLAAKAVITLHQRPFVERDVDGCALVFVATGSREVDEQVKAAAHARGIWTNVADVPDLCDFHLPATVRRGDLQLCIASGGGAPFAVRRLRQLFDDRLSPIWSDWMDAAKGFRKRVRALGLSAAETDRCHDRFFAATVDKNSLAARAPSDGEMAALCAPDDTAKKRSGRVFLVGAGPGNPGLLTVEGLRRLRGADAVVYDRLAIPAIPLDLPDSVALHSVGKEAGRHPVPQDAINDLLIRLAREGKHVVRLKGGDPFVFARGGEEMQALRKVGIACDVISGVTAGIAVPAAAGIPVTYRGEAVRLTFITAHEGGTPQMQWELLAHDPHATLVGYMGVSNLAEVSAALIRAGMSPDMPAAIIEQGTLPRQRALHAPISHLAGEAARHAMQPPAVFVIGRAVGQASREEPRPLAGTCFAMFAPSDEIAGAMQELGATVLAPPLPLTQAARLVLAASSLSGFLVRADAEARALAHARDAQGFAPGFPLWCVNADLAALARQLEFPNVIGLETGASDAELVERIRARLMATPGPQAVRPA